MFRPRYSVAELEADLSGTRLEEGLSQRARTEHPPMGTLWKKKYVASARTPAGKRYAKKKARRRGRRGGRAEIGKQVAEALAKRGIPVPGTGKLTRFAPKSKWSQKHPTTVVTPESKRYHKKVARKQQRAAGQRASQDEGAGSAARRGMKMAFGKWQKVGGHRSESCRDRLADLLAERVSAPQPNDVRVRHVKRIKATMGERLAITAEYDGDRYEVETPMIRDEITSSTSQTWQRKIVAELAKFLRTGHSDRMIDPKSGNTLRKVQSRMRIM